MRFDSERGLDRSEQRVDDSNTRRRFLAGSAGTVGGLALGGAFTSPVFAHEGEDEDDDEGGGGDEDVGETPPETTVEDEFDDDVDILNYLRMLEFLQARFYEEGFDNIGEDELLDAESIADLRDPAEGRLYDDLQTIAAHERDHAETLATILEELGGDPIDEPEMEFGSAVEAPPEFVTTAVVLEDTGVSAYAGAAPFIEDDRATAAALSIHSVEARHASFLRRLDGDVGFPSPYDQPRSRSTVAGLAGDFLAGDVDEILNDDS